ncbi:MAG: D-glycero-alpha-D-manno-heptose-1,7-bisphosphate 7-phosphatase [Alphaproteobacteria bacterium]
MVKNKALFLDRDGTINVDYGYVGSIDKFEFIDGVFEFCGKAQSLGYKIIVITNQSGIARGYYTVTDYQKVTKYMCDEFLKRGIKITDVFYCPELSGPNRKPEPGLFVAARDKHNIDMIKSVSVGDKQRDLDAAIAAGVVKNFLFQNNYAELGKKL